MGAMEIQATLTEAGQFSEPLPVRGASLIYGPGVFDLSVSGEFTGTITLQLSSDNGVSWADTGDAFTASDAQMGETATAVLLRLGVKEDADWSGTAQVRLAQ